MCSVSTMVPLSFSFLSFSLKMLFVAPFLLLRSEATTIVVSQENGKDNTSCLHEKTVPCRTLDYALRYVKNSSFSGNVSLQSGYYPYNLTEHFHFINKTNISLAGNGESSFVKVDCHRNGSLSFERSENIRLSGILLHGCGGLHNSTAGDAFAQLNAHIQFHSAVFFVYCKNVVIESCWIINSSGIGINMYDVSGVKISHSRFEGNGHNENFTSTNVARAGGGIYMEFTYRGGEFPFDQNSSFLAEFDSNNTFIITNCTFKNNLAPKQSITAAVENPYGDHHFPFGRGGGVSIFVKGAAENNFIEISLCNFTDNHALWGGGIFIEYQDEVQNNTLEVTRCIFKNNKADFAGGAIRSGTLATSDKQQLIPNQIKHEDCTFDGNKAVLGGGVSHHGTSSYLKVFNDESMYVQYINCVWKNNTATMGSAIGLASPRPINGLSDLHGRGPMLIHRIVLEHCNVTNNMIVLTDDEHVIGQGAIYSFSTPIVFKGVDRIAYNNNTAMVVENAVVHVFGHVTFRYNIGGQGGALGLYGASVIMLMPHSQLNFFNNTAAERGGAIYVKDSGPPVVAFETTELNTRTCFVAYNNHFSLNNVTQWKTKIVFGGNEVNTTGGGDSVYASTLDGCRWANQPRINNESLEWPNTILYLDRNKSSKVQIATDAFKIQINISDWMVSPSESFDATVKLIDEKNSSVLGVVNVTIVDGNVTLGTASNLFLIQGHNPKINKLSLKGKQGSDFKVHVNTIAGRVVHKLSETVMLRGCYPGFEQKDGETCSCMQEAGIAKCNGDFKRVMLKSGYWGGFVDDKFSTYPCPPDYCSDVCRASSFLYDSETICTAGRDGSSVLCGACKDHYSVNLGDEHCQEECLNSHLWLLLVFFIMTLLLVLVVLRIELDIFTTYLNAWLYSYQIITFLLQEGQYLDPFITFIIGVANWRVKGVGACLFHGMTNLYKLGINYILPSYVLLLLFALGKIARYRPSCYINKNVSRAFCTLLVLCYTNVTLISWRILHYVPINGSWVLYADGNIDFTRDWRKHLPFTIFACLWIVFFVLFLPLVLLFTPWFLRRIPYLNNFRLFFDTFQRCFKDEYRWFAAYYFICRVFILLIALYVPFGSLKRSILEASSVIIVVTCVYLRPYKTDENDSYNWLNTLDAILLTNLCFVVIFSSSVVNDASDSIQDGLKDTVNVLAYVPLVYLVCLICYNGWKYFCSGNLNNYFQVPPQEAESISETVHPPQLV